MDTFGTVRVILTFLHIPLMFQWLGQQQLFDIFVNCFISVNWNCDSSGHIWNFAEKVKKKSEIAEKIYFINKQMCFLALLQWNQITSISEAENNSLKNIYSN